jgi:hypothetical protein
MRELRPRWDLEHEFSNKAHRAGGVASQRVMIATHGMEPARAKPLRTKRKGEES